MVLGLVDKPQEFTPDLHRIVDEMSRSWPHPIPAEELLKAGGKEFDWPLPVYMVGMALGEKVEEQELIVLRPRWENNRLTLQGVMITQAPGRIEALKTTSAQGKLWGPIGGETQIPWEYGPKHKITSLNEIDLEGTEIEGVKALMQALMDGKVELTTQDREKIEIPPDPLIVLQGPSKKLQAENLIQTGVQTVRKKLGR